MPPPPRLRDLLAVPAADLARVLVPAACAGCGRPDVTLCPACLRELAGMPAPVEALPAPVYSLGPYAGCRRAAVLAWKSGDRRDLGPVFARLARDAGRALAPRLGGAASAAPGGAPALAVVPAPSGLGRRLSGRLVVADAAEAMARGLAAGLARPEPGPPVGPVVALDLLVRAGRRTQAGRGARARSAARRGHVAALAPLPPGTPVLLVDDVLASGATLAACADAVARAGGTVLGALVFAHAQAGRGAGPGAAGGR